MATISRQPFAPLDGARLQSLTSLKNRQNGACSTAEGIELRVQYVDMLSTIH